MLGFLRSRSILSMLGAAAVLGLGAFGAPAPAHAGGGTRIVVATPGVFVSIGDRRDFRPRYKYKDYGYRSYYRHDDRKFRRGYRDYDRHYYRDRGYRYDCDRRGRRFRY
jgi:hypothetical protein